jgi:hypothetical protein
MSLPVIFIFPAVVYLMEGLIHHVPEYYFIVIIGTA